MHLFHDIFNCEVVGSRAYNNGSVALSNFRKIRPQHVVTIRPSKPRCRMRTLQKKTNATETLVVHTLVGLAYFAAMAVPAVIIYKTKEWLERFGVTGFTMTMLHAAEAVFLLFDFYAICRYAYSSSKEGH